MEELNDWLARPRGLDDNFLNALENGILMPLLAEVRTDRDLILEIRNNYVDVYCKGQCLANVRQYRSSKRYRIEAHEKFSTSAIRRRMHWKLLRVFAGFVTVKRWATESSSRLRFQKV